VGSAFRLVCVFNLIVVSCFGAVTPTDYYNHVVFDNSLTPDYYYYSSGRSVFPSTIELLSGALPVEHKTFFTAPNALRLQWRSRARGELGGGGARGQHAQPAHRTFAATRFTCGAIRAEAIPAADLPFIQLEDEQHDFTAPVKLERGSPATSLQNAGSSCGFHSANS
jgi:hypothetical protein